MHTEGFNNKCEKARKTTIQDLEAKHDEKHNLQRPTATLWAKSR